MKSGSFKSILIVLYQNRLIMHIVATSRVDLFEKINNAILKATK